MERTQRMVRFGTQDEDEGNAMILEDKQRIAEIEADLRAAGSVMSLPALYIVQAACDRIANGPEPKTFEEQRPVLEKLVDLKITYGDGEVVIAGKVPVPEAAEAPGRNGRKCNSSHGRMAERHGGPIDYLAGSPVQDLASALLVGGAQSQSTGELLLAGKSAPVRARLGNLRSAPSANRCR
jgi:hypothetical protein